MYNIDCHKQYISKTLRNLNKRIYEYKCYILKNIKKTTLNVLVVHCNESGQNIDFKNVVLI